MEDSEDLKKIDEVIQRHKVETQEYDEIEYAEFIDYDDNPNDCDEFFESENFDIPSCMIKANITEINSYAPSQFLTESEKQVVDSCTDPLLKELLLLNRTKNMQLMQLYRKIKDLLVECQDNIAASNKRINMVCQTKKAFSRVWRLGIPYFKTQDDFPCPKNADVRRKHENGELFFYEMTPSPKWVLKDMNRLLKAVAFQYKVRRESELEKQIKALKNNTIADCEKAEVIQELRNKLKSIKQNKTASYPPVHCDEYLDWDRISKHFFNQKYSDRECQIFWKTYLHPDINKSSWSAEENEKLDALASANFYQNWDYIAKQLGNNRTGFITCVHYYCAVSPPVINGRFAPNEDKLLLDLVSHYRQGEYIPWTKIAHHFLGRTRGQLFYRYKYFLCGKENNLRGKFSTAEDVLIMILVDRFGRKFSKCAEYIPHRSAVQLKSRFNSSLKERFKKGSFTVEEDRLILDHVKQSETNSWEVLVPVLKRNGAQIRQRYSTLMSFQGVYDNADLEAAPRRRYNAPYFAADFDYKRWIADKFKNCERIPSVEDIDRLLGSTATPEEKLSKRSFRPNYCKKKKEEESETSGLQNISLIHDRIIPSLAVDELLTDYFRRSAMSKFEQHLENDYIRRAASTLASILSILQAELHIPETYKEDPRLEAMDVRLLDVLKKKNPVTLNAGFLMKRNSLHVEHAIPPNSNTLIGMRNILIRNEIYKAKCVQRTYEQETFRKEDAEKQVLWCINTHLSSQSEYIRNEILIERRLFYKRFASIFKFPAVLSLVAPSKTLCEEQVLCKVVKTYARKRKSVPQQQNQTLPVQCCPLENELNKHTREVFRNKTETNNSKSNGSNSSRQADVNQESNIKLSIVEQLKKRISETLHDLTMCQSKKNFKSVTEVNPDLYCRNQTRPVNDKIDKGTANVKTVVKNGIQMNKNTTVKGKEAATKKRSNPKRKAESISSASIKTSKSKRAKITVANALKKTRSKKKLVTGGNANETTNSVQLHDLPNLSEDELVLKDAPSNHSISTNKDLCDVQRLDEVLKKEQDSDDEFFEF